MRCDECHDLVELPDSFLRSSALGQAPATLEAQSSTPLTRPDPTSAWYDLATVANVVTMVANVLRS